MLTVVFVQVVHVDVWLGFCFLSELFPHFGYLLRMAAHLSQPARFRYLLDLAIKTFGKQIVLYCENLSKVMIRTVVNRMSN